MEFARRRETKRKQMNIKAHRYVDTETDREAQTERERQTYREKDRARR